MSKTNYTFGGWYDNAEFSGIAVTFPVTNVTSAKVFWAKWTINSYDVTFVDHDGTELKIENVNHGSNATAPTAPPRIGYTFTGWDVSFTNVTDDITVTATYTINVYTVTFVDGLGVTLKVESVEHGSDATAPMVEDRVSHTFAGWNVSFTNVTGSLTATAQWQIRVYTVTFVDWNGHILDEQDIEHGSVAVVPSTPIRGGYTFGGWYRDVTWVYQWHFDGDIVISNITLYAKWTINTYIVTFKDWDGKVLARPGSAATAPADPTRTGYTFVGWDISFDDEAGELTAMATYTINSYAVKFVDYDGKTLKRVFVNHGYSATAPTEPARTGYTFANWDVAFDDVIEPLTVTAVYTINSYTVTFVDHDGKVLKSQSVNHDGDATAPTSPTRTGYTFAGWDVAFTGVTANLTVTATWTPIPVVNAAMPTISTQPTGGTVAVGAVSSLSVSATRSDAGTLSYQWYSNTTNSNSGGKAISGATSATYSPSTATAGMYYFYVMITNTNNSVNGDTAATVTSSVATLVVSPTTSIQLSDKTVPIDIDNGAAVIPSTGTSAFELSVGPNPVQKSDGAMKIFASGKSITSGTLTIYDATGNVVRKIDIRDNDVAGANNYSPLRLESDNRRVIGEWDLKDVRGRSVPAGTYLVRGIIKIVDGKREKVSAVIGVR